MPDDKFVCNIPSVYSAKGNIYLKWLNWRVNMPQHGLISCYGYRINQIVKKIISVCSSLCIEREIWHQEQQITSSHFSILNGTTTNIIPSQKSGAINRSTVEAKILVQGLWKLQELVDSHKIILWSGHIRKQNFWRPLTFWIDNPLRATQNIWIYHLAIVLGHPMDVV